jgi:esterase/lipase superfamily enzyme
MMLVVVSGLTVVAGCADQGARSAPEKSGAGSPAPASEETEELPSDLTEPPMTEAARESQDPAASTEDSGESGAEPAASSAPVGRSEKIRRTGETTERRGYSPERIFFATNRQPDSTVTAATDPDLYFGDERGEITWGTCEVSIPYRRRPGTLPEPSILRLEFTQDPAKHVVLMEIEMLPDAEFWMRLRARVEASQEKKLLLFVHGYCATFRDAARRTAQMAYDINYQGPSMFFSWPAGSESERFEEKANYLKDLGRAEESDEDLITVLEGISRYSGAERIHLIAHSMGNFVLTEALKTMDDRRHSDTPQEPLFDQVALAAPDINAREFVERTGARLKPFSRRYTVYASTGDKALWLSKKVNGFEPLGFLNQFSRSGASSKLFDLVDASQLTSGWFDSGHIYYGDMPEVLSDFRMVFQGIQATSLQRSLAETPPMFRLTPHSR